VYLKGISFGNDVWANKAIPDTHHNELDYARISGWGMNVVRFYMNYRTFEDDAAPFVYKDEGFAWLDMNVKWAKAHGVKLILNIHVPQGGFQSDGDGSSLWTDPRNQERLIALWRAIASRYANEPTIAGYDLLNEPSVTESKEQWRSLAERTIAAIRTVDDNHLIVIERLGAIAGDWSLDDELNFFLVSDANVAYTFHFYLPVAYTLQSASWTTFGEGGRYPDETRTEWLNGVEYRRNRAYLEAALDNTLAWGKRHDVPLYLGEFGAITYCFENDRGGIAWVSDMLDALLARSVHFTYHAYHEDWFAVYYGTGTLPDPTRSNQKLIELFQQKL
jgi:aryl-phospho-beta-D-glucosidase BglC (GH1 family)